MFVPRTPRRYDFCGCPPCGLCFDWVEPAPPPPPPKKAEEDFSIVDVAPVVVDGIVKMTEDLTGKPIAECTEDEKEQVKRIAEDMHNRNLVNALNPQPPDEGGAHFDQENEDRFFWRAVTLGRQDKEREKVYEEAKAAKKPNLDDMGWGEQQRKEEQEKELKKAAEEEKQKERTKVKLRERERQAALERLQKDSYNEYLRNGPRW